MMYSFTQLSHYLSCPRRYRHRYLDGWQEKGTRAAMLFGRAFEQALAAYFRKEDAAVTLYREWAAYKTQPLHYSERDSWDGMLQQGIQLLERFCQEDRVRVRQPRRNLQTKFVRPLPEGNESSLTWTRLESSTAAGACWNGRQHRAVIRRLRKGCLPLTLNCCATRGSREFRKSRK